jgi:hypothetical protein
VPKALRQPVPQYCTPLPQKYHSEQQLPKPEPAQVVTFPHWPFEETISVPDGSGGRAEELEGTTTELDDVDGEGVGVGVGVGVGLGAFGGASPHLPYCGWHPTMVPQCLPKSECTSRSKAYATYSGSVPQKSKVEQHCPPVQLAPPALCPHRPASWRVSN